jgi:hypothetical protein
LYRKAKIFQSISPSRENGAPECPQTLRCSEIINILSADYAQQRGAQSKSSSSRQPCIPSHKGVYWGKKEAFAMWFVYALGSAVFAALTSILAKIGIEGVNSTLATAIRTAVVLLMSWGMVFLTGTQTGIAEISHRSWLFLVLSGLATGASWLCYYHALQIGAASKVVPIDKLSVVITLALAFVVLHEPFTAKSLIGCALITAGTLFMVL